MIWWESAHIFSVHFSTTLNYGNNVVIMFVFDKIRGEIFRWDCNQSQKWISQMLYNSVIPLSKPFWCSTLTHSPELWNPCIQGGMPGFQIWSCNPSWNVQQHSGTWPSQTWLFPASLVSAEPDSVSWSPRQSLVLALEKGWDGWLCSRMPLVWQIHLTDG